MGRWGVRASEQARAGGEWVGERVGEWAGKRVGEWVGEWFGEHGPAVSHVLEQMVPKLVWSDNGCTSTPRVADEQ